MKKAVDFEKLKNILGDALTEEKEVYEFTWPGKRQSMLEALRPLRKVLRPSVEESINWDKAEHIFIEGDNLEALKLIRESYLGKVKMIYIDPPYNTGHDFIYPDSYKMGFNDYAVSANYYDENGNIVDAEGNILIPASLVNVVTVTKSGWYIVLIVVGIAAILGSAGAIFWVNKKKKQMQQDT